MRDEAELQAYAVRHSLGLRPLVLFEIAHEGLATDTIRAAGRLAGIEEDVERWHARVAAWRAKP